MRSPTRVWMIIDELKESDKKSGNITKQPHTKCSSQVILLKSNFVFNFFFSYHIISRYRLNVNRPVWSGTLLVLVNSSSTTKQNTRFAVQIKFSSLSHMITDSGNSIVKILCTMNMLKMNFGFFLVALGVFVLFGFVNFIRIRWSLISFWAISILLWVQWNAE